MTTKHTSLINQARIRQSLFPSFVLSKNDTFLKERNRPYDHDGPASPSHAWSTMFEKWELPVHLNGGTLAMREAGHKYLPIEEGEENELYLNRLYRTVLYGAYSKTVKTLSSLPFNCPIQIAGLPEELEYLKTEADGDSETIEAFSERLLQDLFNFGIAHILVEHPTAAMDEEGNPVPRTLLQEREENIRPYFSRVDPLKLISWSTKIVGSKTFLEEIRIFEDVIEPDPLNRWNQVHHRQVRVVHPDMIELFRTEESARSTEGQYNLVGTVPNDLGKIGLITIYANKIGYMQAAPMLEELAWLNLRHYQKLSDLDNIEHVANVPFALATGVPADELNNVTIAAHRMLKTSSEKANVKYVEHSGAAIEASQNSIEMLENRMTAMGAEMITPKVATRETATGKTLDSTKSISTLQNLVVDLEQGLAKAFQIAGEWLDIGIPAPKVNIGDKLSLTVDANLLTSLIDLARQNNMSFEDLAAEMKRRNMLSDSTELQPGNPQPGVSEDDNESQE